jgi:hypothetical protein
LDFEVSPAGRSVYHVVDGKQRLTAIIEYVKDKFSSSESYSGPELGGGSTTASFRSMPKQASYDISSQWNSSTEQTRRICNKRLID